MFIRICSLIFLHAISCSSKTFQPEIAVVGAGIGGSTAAYFLRQLFGEETLIDVYESRHVGGRLGTVQLDGKQYEAGGAIIHPANEYMVNFTRLFGLEHRTGGGRLGIFDGKQMVFDGSSNDILLGLQLIYRYGLDIFRINSFVKEMLSDFKRIYDHQDNGYSFTTVEKLLASMSPKFVTQLKKTVREEMKDVGLSDLFIDELVRGAMRTNYGQDIDVGGFVGAVSMAGVEPGLFAIRGGNKLVPENLVKHSKVKFIPSRVHNITLAAGKNAIKYAIASKTASGQVDNKIYDIVIVASPLHDKLTDINFRSFPQPIGNFPQHFQRKPTLFVKGLPNPKYFGFDNVNEIPEEILTSNSDYKICSVGKNTPVTNSPYDVSNELPVYKIFTNEPLSEDEIQEIFPNYKDKVLVDWRGAYPVYDSPDLPIPPFVLNPQLYYVNGIELAASAMEMSAIGGRNVAILAHANWNEDELKIDGVVVMREGLEEESQNVANDEL